MCRILFRQSPFGQILRIVISGSSAGKESVCNARDCCSISGSRRAPGEGIRYPLQYSWASLVAQMVNPPAVWENRVRSLVGKIPWRRKWQHTLVLLPGKFHGLRSLIGYSPWGLKESNTTSLSLSEFP